ncbi:MAG: host attachment protein [Cocleimonas sp.]
MSKIWVVVADEAKARILSTSKSTEPLVEIQSFSSPEAHDREQDLVSDKPGKGSNGSGEGKHAMDEKHTHKEQYALHFAKELGNLLEKNQQSKTYVKLIIVAAPRFLGLLRKELSKGVNELVSLEIDKDLTMMEPQAIREHLPQYL